MRLVATWFTMIGAFSVLIPTELMTAIAATVTMKINAATTRLRSRNSPMADGVAAVDRPVRRAFSPPTRSLSWLRTDIRVFPAAVPGSRSQENWAHRSDADLADTVPE